MDREELSTTTGVTQCEGSEAEYDFLYSHFGAQRHDHGDHADWKEMKLIEFRIYEISGDSARPESLHNVIRHESNRRPRYCFDGTLLHDDGSTQTVKSVYICKVSIGNLRDVKNGNPPETTNTPIWLETKISAKYHCWYVLEAPSASYDTSFRNFRWLAQFAKHIIDYLAWSSSKNQTVSLANLTKDFITQVFEWHKDDATFREWHTACGGVFDFRQHLACATHASFVYGQAYDIGDEYEDEVLLHLVWDEIGQPVETRNENEKAGLRKTISTAHAAMCFLQIFPDWGRNKWDLLKVAVMEPVVQQWHNERRQSLGLNQNTNRAQTKTPLNVSSILETTTLQMPPLGKLKRSVAAGKAILVAVCDGHGCRSWPCPKAEYRFAYVQKADRGYLHVSWLLTPARTACVGRYAGRNPRKKATAYYPITNELFWNGDDVECTILRTNSVVGVYDISVNSDHIRAGNELFVHRAYHHKDCSFRTSSEIKPNMAPTPGDRKSARITDVVPKEPKVLSLFSGMGLFDQGIEYGSGGLFQANFAADLNGEALKTYQANHSKSQECQFHHEDVNILLNQICRSTDVTRFPDVDCLIAGCPCPGFSNLNPNKDNERSQKNCSLLAHTLSWVEVLLPRMVVIENVPPMDACAENAAAPTAAGQGICHLVSLGYQAKIATIRSSDYGGATDRNRIFIIATIPEIPLPDIPGPIHGKEINQYASVTAKAATADLEVISNDTEINIIHPDHVPFERLTQFERRTMELIPKTVPSEKKRMANLADALPFMNRGQRRWFSGLSDEQQGSGGNTFRRVHPNHPMQTITTRAILLDARGSPKIHWLSDRVVSLLELRRGQGVPEDYILVGDKHSQLKQIGNSVAWATSAILGKAIAASWRTAYPVRFQAVLPELTPSRNFSSMPVQNSRGHPDRIKHKLESDAKPDDLPDSENEMKEEPYFVHTTSDDWQQSPPLALTPSPFSRFQFSSALLSKPFSTTSSSSGSASSKPTQSPTTRANVTVNIPPRKSLPETPSARAKVTVKIPPLPSKQVPSVPPGGTSVRPKLFDKTITRSAPTKPMSEIYRAFKERERLFISPGGSLHMERKTTSKVTVRRRRASPSDDEDSDTTVSKRPRTRTSTSTATGRALSNISTRPRSSLLESDDSDENILQRRRFDAKAGIPLVNIPRLIPPELLRKPGIGETRSQSLVSRLDLVRTATEHGDSAGKSIETAIEIDD